MLSLLLLPPLNLSTSSWTLGVSCRLNGLRPRDDEVPLLSMSLLAATVLCLTLAKMLLDDVIVSGRSEELLRS